MCILHGRSQIRKLSESDRVGADVDAGASLVGYGRSGDHDRRERSEGLEVDRLEYVESPRVQGGASRERLRPLRGLSLRPGSLLPATWHALGTWAVTKSVPLIGVGTVAMNQNRSMSMVRSRLHLELTEVFVGEAHGSKPTVRHSEVSSEMDQCLSNDETGKLWAASEPGPARGGLDMDATGRRGWMALHWVDRSGGSRSVDRSRSGCQCAGQDPAHGLGFHELGASVAAWLRAAASSSAGGRTLACSGNWGSNHEAGT